MDLNAPSFTVVTRADKGWAVKRARSSKKVTCSGSGLGSNYGQRDEEYQGNLRKESYFLKGFVNRLSHYCEIDIDRDASNTY